MKLCQQWWYACLFLAAVSCSDALKPPRATSDEDRPAVLRIAEGVSGQVKEEDGRPIAGASVLAAPVDPNGPAVPEMAVVSDSTGRYEWPLRPGRYELTVIAEGYERASRVVSVRAGEVATLDFRLTRRR